MNKGSDISDLTTKVPNPHLYLLFQDFSVGGPFLVEDYGTCRDVVGTFGARRPYGVWEGWVVLQPWEGLGPLGGSEPLEGFEACCALGPLGP